MSKHTQIHSRLSSFPAMALLSLSMASLSLAATCEELATLKLPNTVIKSAQRVGAGEFSASGRGKQADFPGFCRVVVSVRPAPDSDIGVEVWMPTDQWKGVFHGNGNGGYGGSLNSGYAGMEAGLRRGFASATTDTGTAPATGLNGDPLRGHPQKWKDWGMLSTHVMTETGKAIVKAFYGEDPKRSYYTGCSTGGQQGLIEAQYYPEDYSGVLVGAPVMNRTWGHALAIWDYRAANFEPGHKLSDAKLALLHKAAIAACGAKGNGLATDPFISDPPACKFDPADLMCKGAESDSCLTAGQVQTAKDFYSGPVDRAGHPTYYGWEVGSEGPGRSGWGFTEVGFNNEPAFDGLFKWVFGKEWDWRQFDFDRDMPKVDAELGSALNGVTRGDLSRFQKLGGKLIIYHGWADTLVAPRQTLAFYNALAGKAGGSRKEQEFARLFLAPGMMHCGGGDGLGAFNSANGGTRNTPSDKATDDLFAAMIHWVEDGVAPSEVIATKYIEDSPAKGIAMRRPLCAYPQKAWYKGSGDTNAASNFVCSVEKPAKR